VVVNPKYRELDGVRSVPILDRDVAAAATIDLALIALGQSGVEVAIEQCAAAGVGAAVVLGSGYAETGDEGRSRQILLAEQAKAAGVRLLGPNCQGFINVVDRVAASFTAALDVSRLDVGGIALITQSGALGGVLLNRAQERGLGLSLWVSTGNEADVTWLDCVEYALDHPATRAVAVYGESIPGGRRLIALGARARELKIPLVVLIGGLTRAGGAAAQSHTGALVDNTRVALAALREAGIIAVRSLDELLDVAETLVATPMPSGTRLAILTTSGGAGVLLADSIEETPAQLAQLESTSIVQLRACLPSFATPRNPIDVTAQILQTPELLRQVLEVVFLDSGVDIVAVLLTMVVGDLADQVARCLVETCHLSQKPVVVVWMAGTLGSSAYGILRAGGLPCFPTLTSGLGALAGLARWASAQQQPTRPIPFVTRVPEVPVGVLSERVARAFLAAYGVPGPREIFCETLAEATAAADHIGYPVVIKVEADGLAHKTEFGGVRLGLASNEAVRLAASAMLADVTARLGVEPRGILVQEHVRGLVELLVGAIRDSVFGPVVSCGIGGIFAEVYRDVTLRLAPVDEEEARQMLGELRGFPLLMGVRGRPPGDVDAAARVIAAVSQAACDLGDHLQELELNPLIVRADGAGVVAVDALAVIRDAKALPLT
jgi:acetyltransferase